MENYIAIYFTIALVFFFGLLHPEVHPAKVLLVALFWPIAAPWQMYQNVYRNH